MLVIKISKKSKIFDTNLLIYYSINRLSYIEVNMETTTVRIPKEKRDTLKIISSVERRDLKDILSELIDEYIERHRETLELLSKPEWVEIIKRGKKEIKDEVRGKSLDELED